MRIQRNTFTRQAGITLIESLVSLFIFAVGALGLAALQTTAIIQSDDSKQRSAATWKGQELVDRMLSSRSFADPDGLMQEYLNAIGGDANGIASFGVDNAAINCNNPPPVDCSSEECTSAELIQFEIDDVICDDDTGLATSNADSTGSFGVSDMDLTLLQDNSDVNGDGTPDTYYELYIAWQSRSASQNFTDGTDSGAENGISGTVGTNLCGNTIAVDVRVDAICIRFQ